MRDVIAIGSRCGWKTRRRNRVACLVTVFTLLPVFVRAGDGVVALQTADPSCSDDSGDIYVDCGNGTVTDNRTGLVWLANADCLGGVDWVTAMEFVAGLSDKPATSAAAAHDCGLSDGSSAGEWRLPSIEEWAAMVADALGEDGDPDCRLSPPTITNDSGLGCWATGGGSFSGVVVSSYWAATTVVNFPFQARSVDLESGTNAVFLDKTIDLLVWPVRDGQ